MDPPIDLPRGIYALELYSGTRVSLFSEASRAKLRGRSGPIRGYLTPIIFKTIEGYLGLYQRVERYIVRWSTVTYHYGACGVAALR